MAERSPSPPPPTDSQLTEPDALSGFFSEILKPGSSLHPIFQLCVDIAFGLLVLVLVSCAFVTNGNVHFLALTVIAIALWASIKWFVHELQAHQATNQTSPDNNLPAESKKSL